MSSHNTFAVSEILPDNQVLVIVYVRIELQVHLVMTLYSDATMREGQQLLDVHLMAAKREQAE